MVDRNPMCGDEAKLLAYTAGALDRNESAALEAHLRDCSRCRQRVRENEEIARLYLSARGGEEPLHPSPAELTALAEGELDPPARAALRDHLDGCEECRQIVFVLEKVQMEIHSPRLLQELRNLAGALVSGWRGIGAGLPPWARSPVPAYLLVLLMLYPAYLGLSGWSSLEQRVEELEIPTLLPPPMSLESEAERGSKEPHLIVDRREGRIVLTFFIPIAPERYRYQVELRQRRTPIFSVPDAQSFDGIGTFVLFLPEGSLDPGAYELRVEEIHRQSGAATSAASFPFSIAR